MRQVVIDAVAEIEQSENGVERHRRQIGGLDEAGNL
jgi:hypothetical protein